MVVKAEAEEACDGESQWEGERGRRMASVAFKALGEASDIVAGGDGSPQWSTMRWTLQAETGRGVHAPNRSGKPLTAEPMTFLNFQRFFKPIQMPDFKN
jgi:hypothetical protein